MPSQYALVVQEDKSLKMQEVEMPTIGNSDVLVKNVAVASNPTDWKNIEFGFAGPKKVVGCDFAGVVESVGSDVKNLKVGDRVAGFLQGGLEHHHGAFQLYVRTPADLVYRIPGNISFEEAASMNLAGHTAALGLRKLFNYPKAPPKDSSILVWGATSSVAMYAIQLAKLAGLTVFTTASQRHHKFVQSLGADHVFDRHDKDLMNKIKAIVPEGVDFVFDCISTQETAQEALKALKQNGSMAILLPLNLKELNRPDVKFHVFLVYSIFGRQVDTFGLHLPASKEDRDFGAQFYKMMGELLESGKLKPNPIDIRPNGLLGIPDGLKMMKEGKNSAVKLVYRISETPMAAK